MPDTNPTWADTAGTLLSKLSGGVEVSFAFDQMEVQVPSPQGPAATGRVNGSLRVPTKGDAAPLSPASPTSVG